MNEAAFRLGQLLSVADVVHAGYCADVRQGQVPPALLGNRCAKCGTVFFPSATGFCRNPACDSESFEDIPLSRRGTVWSFAVNHYPPPEPYKAPDPFVPYTVAAVSLGICAPPPFKNARNASTASTG